MLKKKKLLCFSIIFLAVLAVTLIVIDNIPRDYRNLDKLEEYHRNKDLAISQHLEAYKRMLTMNADDYVKLTYEERLEQLHEEQELYDSLYVVCTSIEELREYAVMSNRDARKIAREMARKAKEGHHPDCGNLLFCDFKSERFSVN